MDDKDTRDCEIGQGCMLSHLGSKGVFKSRDYFQNWTAPIRIMFKLIKHWIRN